VDDPFYCCSIEEFQNEAEKRGFVAIILANAMPTSGILGNP